MSKRKRQKTKQNQIIDVEGVSVPEEGISVPVKKSEKTVLYLEFMLSETRAAQIKEITKAVTEAGFKFASINIDAKPKMPFVERIEGWVKENGMPIATLRWDEHGGLYGRMNSFKSIAKWGYKNKVAPIACDFAYFNHYKGYMFDLLTKDGEPSIKGEWEELGKDLKEMKDIPGPLGKYIMMIHRSYDRSKYLNSIGHLKPTYKYVGFTQSLMNQCRLPLEGHDHNNDPDQWMAELSKLFGGDQMIFKGQPAPFMRCGSLSRFRFYEHVKEAGPVGFFHAEMEQNASIAANAQWVITNSSGVTNEFVIGGLPVITTGVSWFNDLGIFEEPNSWDELYKIASDPNWKIPANSGYNRLKWINWWVKHQFFAKDKYGSTLFNNLLRQFNDRVS